MYQQTPFPPLCAAFSALRARMGLLLLVALVLVLPLPAARPAGAQGSATMALEPSTSSHGIGEIFQLNVVVNAGSQQVDGAEFHLAFDPGVLQVVDASGSPSATISPGPSLPVVLTNAADNARGRVDYAAGDFDEPFPTGSFVLATIMFRAVAGSAGSQVRFVERNQVVFAGAQLLGRTIDAIVVVGGPTAVPTTPPPSQPIVPGVPVATATPFPPVFTPGVPLPGFTPPIQTAGPQPSPLPSGVDRPQAAAYAAMAGAGQVFLPIAMRARNGWTTLLALQNLGGVGTQVTVRFLGETGEQVTAHALSVPAGGSRLLDPRTVPGLADGYVGSAVVEGGGQRVAASVSEVRAGSDALAYTGEGSGGEVAYAPLLFNAYRGWDTGLQVQNLGDAPVPVTVTYAGTGRSDGPWTEGALVAARSSHTFFQPANPDLPGDWVGSAVVQAPPGSRIMAVVNQVHPSGSGSSYEAAVGGSAVVNAPLLFKSSEGWSTGLQVQNVGASFTEVVVTYRGRDGSGPWVESAGLAAGASATFYQPSNAELPEGFVGSAVVSSLAGLPLVAIVNQVHAARGVSMTYQALAAGSVTLAAPHLARGADGWSTGVQVQNLGTEATTVTLRLRGPEGTLVASPSETIPAGESRTFFLPSLAGLPAGWRGSGTIESTPPQPLGAIVNQVRY